MIIPIRCFTCGKLLGDKHEVYKERLELGEKPEDVFHELGIDRYCCRRMIISHVDLMDEVIKYKKPSA
jgi:DNA-directed RNA polymerase subunit N